MPVLSLDVSNKTTRKATSAMKNNPWKNYLSTIMVCVHKPTNKGTAFITSSLCKPVRTAHKPRGLPLWVSFMLNQAYTGLLNSCMSRCFSKTSGHSLTPSVTLGKELAPGKNVVCPMAHIITPKITVVLLPSKPLEDKPCGYYWAVGSWFILWGGKKIISASRNEGRKNLKSLNISFSYTCLVYFHSF